MLMKGFSASSCFGFSFLSSGSAPAPSPQGNLWIHWKGLDRVLEAFIKSREGPESKERGLVQNLKPLSKFIDASKTFE